MRNERQFYEKDALRVVPESVKRIEELRYRMLISKVPKWNKKVLDIGCGNGELICMLAEKGHECTALDFSKNRLAKFEEKAKELGVAQMQGNARNIPLGSSSIDVVMCSELLEHIKDYEKILKESYRVLKSYSKIIISVPYNEKLMKVLCPNCGEKFVPHGHFHSFDKTKLFLSMDYCGFNVKYSHVGPSLISRVISRFVRINTPSIFFIDKLVDKLSKRFELNRWLIAVGEKKKGK